ncbi:hypothetical protein, partial [Helicobacter cynogastricus]|uniref:hypothetical protein n=1 Tax=Helicobacter cynogastricus TaxID=329937 RepID=UPI0013151612
MGQKDNLYFGGGSLYITPLGQTGERIDIGCLELSLSKESQKTTAWTRAYGAKQKLAEVITEENWTLKIKGNNFSAQALALVLGSEVYTQEVQKGEALPYGGVAQNPTTIQYLKAGSQSQSQSFRLEFVGKSVMGKQVHAIFYNVNLSLDGDLNLMSEEFSTLSLSGACSAGPEGIYSHFISDARQEQEAQAQQPQAAQAEPQTPQETTPPPKKVEVKTAPTQAEPKPPRNHP